MNGERGRRLGVLIQLTASISLLAAGVLLGPGDVSARPLPAATDNPLNQVLAEPVTPIEVDLAIDRLPLLDEPATVICTASSVADAPETAVVIELPDSVQLAGGSLSWRGALTPGQPAVVSATVVFKDTGDAAIRCRALSNVDERTTWGDMQAVYLSVGQEETLDGYAPVPASQHDPLGEAEAAGTGTVVSAEAAYPASMPGDSPDQQPPAVDPQHDADQPAATAPSAPDGNLTITGRWRFYNRDGAVDSEQMIVEIVRGDNGNHLAWCYTDSSGYYTCGPFTNPGGVGVRSRYLSYTNFNPYNDILVTVNPDTGTTGNTANAFAFTTSVQSFSDGTHDIGAWTTGSSNDNRRAFWITNDLIRVWKYVYYQTGGSQNPVETSGPSTVQWKISSTDGTYYSRGGNVHLKGDDPLSKTVVGHEYGHNIMWTIYGAWMPTTYCPSPHYIQYFSHVNCAWTEGWANFITIAVNNEPVYYWASGSTLNLENPTWTTPNWDDGDGVEGRVAGAMWDMLDSANEGDDQWTEGNLVDLWDTIYHQNDSNFSEYWSAWLARGHDNSSAGPIMSLYQSTIEYRNGPANDDFADANVISGNASGYSHINLNTTGATTQGNDPETQCGSTANPKQSRSVWYSFTPNTTANFSFDTEGTDYDTVLAVWSGSWGSLTHRGCDDDGGTGLLSDLYRRLNAGTTYTIEVMRFSSGAGGTMDFHMARDSGPYCYDFNGNGRVDIADIQDVAGRFGNSAAGNLYHDVIPDGVINAADLVEIAGDYNQNCTMAAPLPTLAEQPVEIKE